MKMIKKIIAVILTLALFCTAFFAVQRLFMPKYMSKPFEGALTAEYYADEHRNDVLIIGDCEVYENISPITLWEDYGIPSYIRGSAKQLMWQSYAMLEDALRYETPKVVVLSVLAMMYGEPQADSEPYNRMTLDGLRPSLTKLRAVQASVLPEEELLSYLFPLLRFHSRWSELTQEDWRYFFTRQHVSINGFVMRADTMAAGWIPDPTLLPHYDFGTQAVEALDNITKLCKDKGIQLVLFKAPSLTPYWYRQWDNQIATYAEKNGLRYLNALEHNTDIGLDYETDTYDAGLHMNLVGAEKLARYLGQYLMENCPSLTDRRGDARLAAVWKKKRRQYAALRTQQEAQIAKGEKVTAFMVPEIN
jgi:hypothetical protein